MADVFHQDNPFGSLSTSSSQSSFNFGDWFGNQGGWANLLVPGWSALDYMFDPTGKRAAAQQNAAQLSLNKDAQAYNSAEAEKQRRWEKMMSDTAIQRQVADIKAAGLNPWLALNGGQAQGASSPAGSSAQSSSGSASMANNKLAVAAGIFATALRMFLTKGK